MIRVQGRFQANSSIIMREAVLRGMGLSYSPLWLFEREIASGEVQVLLADWQATPLPIHLVAPPARREAAEVRAFMEFAAGRLA